MTGGLDTVRYFQILLDALDRAGAAHRLPVARRLPGPFGNRRWVVRTLGTLLPQFRQKRAVLDWTVRHLPPGEGAVLEFGVHKGASSRLIAERLPGTAIYGFDSFRGFPEDGRRDWQADFSVDALPELPGNVTLIEGFFEDTLPGFVADMLDGGRAPVRMVHVDCDIYTSTRTIFEALGPVLGPGLTIVFDELLHYRRFLDNEMLALAEMLEARGLDFDWVCLRGRVMGLAEFAERQEARSLPGNFADWRARGFYSDAAIRLRPREAGYEARLARFRRDAEGIAARLRVRQPASRIVPARRSGPGKGTELRRGRNAGARGAVSGGGGSG